MSEGLEKEIKELPLFCFLEKTQTTFGREIPNGKRVNGNQGNQGGYGGD